MVRQNFESILEKSIEIEKHASLVEEESNNWINESRASIS